MPNAIFGGDSSSRFFVLMVIEFLLETMINPKGNMKLLNRRFGTLISLTMLVLVKQYKYISYLVDS